MADVDEQPFIQHTSNDMSPLGDDLLIMDDDVNNTQLFEENHQDKGFDDGPGKSTTTKDPPLPSMERVNEFKENKQSQQPLNFVLSSSKTCSDEEIQDAVGVVWERLKSLGFISDVSPSPAPSLLSSTTSTSRGPLVSPSPSSTSTHRGPADPSTRAITSRRDDDISFEEFHRGYTARALRSWNQTTVETGYVEVNVSVRRQWYRVRAHSFDQIEKILQSRDALTRREGSNHPWRSLKAGDKIEFTQTSSKNSGWEIRPRSSRLIDVVQKYKDSTFYVLFRMRACDYCRGNGDRGTKKSCFTWGYGSEDHCFTCIRQARKLKTAEEKANRLRECLVVSSKRANATTRKNPKSGLPSPSASGTYSHPAPSTALEQIVNELTELKVTTSDAQPTAPARPSSATDGLPENKNRSSSSAENKSTTTTKSSLQCDALPQIPTPKVSLGASVHGPNPYKLGPDNLLSYEDALKYFYEVVSGIDRKLPVGITVPGIEDTTELERDFLHHLVVVYHLGMGNLATPIGRVKIRIAATFLWANPLIMELNETLGIFGLGISRRQANELLMRCPEGTILHRLACGARRIQWDRLKAFVRPGNARYSNVNDPSVQPPVGLPRDQAYASSASVVITTKTAGALNHHLSINRSFKQNGKIVHELVNVVTGMNGGVFITKQDGLVEPTRFGDYSRILQRDHDSRVCFRPQLVRTSSGRLTPVAATINLPEDFFRNPTNYEAFPDTYLGPLRFAELVGEWETDSAGAQQTAINIVTNIGQTVIAQGFRAPRKRLRSE